MIFTNKYKQKQIEQISLNDFIDQNDEKDDPIECIARIDWSQFSKSRPQEEWQHGWMLARQTFQNVDWNQQPGQTASILSQILKKIPQEKTYHHFVTGFKDSLTSILMREVLNNKVNK